jgi:hypothetical protein
MNKYKFYKALYEDELEKKIHNFQKEHEIVSVQFSTCQYKAEAFNGVQFCVMIEYRE